MPRPIPTPDELRDEYRRLFDSVVIPDAWAERVATVVARARHFRFRYEALGLGVPWWWVAAVHSLEGDANFSTHLHNGDSLKRRTVHVPAGRPWGGSPPFLWEVSAADALTMKGLHLWKDWSIPGALYQAERYNGWGYRRFHPDVLSPYLWSGTQHFTRGKYVADGCWSASAQSSQVGAAAIWCWLRANGEDLA